MWIPRPRFTLRWLMLAVAIVGLLMGMGIWTRKLARLKDVYLGRVSHYQSFIKNKQIIVEALELARVEDPDIPRAGIDASLEFIRDELKHLTAMRDKYALAASHPWEHVEEDPPFLLQDYLEEDNKLVPPHPWEPLRSNDPDY